MNTTFLLMAQYNTALIPVDVVCRDFFGGISVVRFLAKVDSGEIKLPLIRMERSQKGMKCVAVADLAEYIDARRKEAVEAMKRAS